MPGAPRKPSIWSRLLRGLSVAQAKVEIGVLTVVRQDGRTGVYRQVDLHLACWCENTWSPFAAGVTLGGGATVRASGRFLTPSQQLNLTLRPAEYEARVLVDHLDLASSGLLSAGSAIGGLAGAAVQVRSTVGALHANGAVRIDRLKLARNGRPSPKPVLASFSLAEARRLPDEEGSGRIERATFSLGERRDPGGGNVSMGEWGSPVGPASRRQRAGH